MRYPLFLNLTKQKVVVVGGGKVATRKIRTLLAAGAAVTVISPETTTAIRRWTQTKHIRWTRRPYRAGDLRGACLVVAATDCDEINSRVCAEARRRRLLVNSAASPSAGNFIVPSVIHRGGITIAISTGGASPAFAKRFRRDIERLFSRGYPALLKQMVALRKRQHDE
jgi:precorrin-2 dehydrogenase/sirohydrochlorin ferrochelatase